MMKKLMYRLGIGIAFCWGLMSCSKTMQQLPEDQGILASVNKKVATASLTTGSIGYVMMTFNIRQDAPDAGNRAWTVRRALVKERILSNNCDIVGVQEALGNQMTNMATDLSDYGKVGVGRDGTSSEHSAIFYKNAKFTALESGTFWLSPGAPTTATGPSWDAAYKRICTWVKLQDKETAFIFYVYNTHFDHQGSQAKINSANLVLSTMTSNIGVNPAILMGDLNANQNSPAYQVLNGSSLLEETWNIAGAKSPTLRVTGNGWNISPIGDSQIDHIFVTNHWTVNSRLVDWYHQVPGNILPSDHFPVIANAKVDGVTIYKDAHYGGKGVFLPKGNYTLADLVARGIENDWASSARVPNGLSVILYEHQDFTGNSWTLTANTPLFSALSPTANDKASSIKIY